MEGPETGFVSGAANIIEEWPGTLVLYPSATDLRTRMPTERSEDWTLAETMGVGEEVAAA